MYYLKHPREQASNNQSLVVKSSIGPSKPLYQSLPKHNIEIDFSIIKLKSPRGFIPEEGLEIIYVDEFTGNSIFNCKLSS
ncbi:hypothetical protein RCL_jg26356.t1 [Rhizophagus clarus]|uniref:Uncharacterized protein n=1 Tax=Rhizophagus clarus TaxID=94130 RepID=A0A8H3KZ78_9GLOM|nr:hypothetical protein RCL_jg26356.t1 [Rhizophagus clarus]